MSSRFGRTILTVHEKEKYKKKNNVKRKWLGVMKEKKDGEKSNDQKNGAKQGQKVL